MDKDNKLDKLKNLHKQLKGLHLYAFDKLYSDINLLTEDKIEEAIIKAEKFISSPFTFPTLLHQLPNITVNPNAIPKEPQFCLCGSTPSIGDTFYYKSTYMKEELEGEVSKVHYDSIVSKNGTPYKFSEIRVKPKWEIRQEKLNKLFGKE